MSSVDVVVPCYKYAHYLETCVASVLSQRGPEIRILIIDDASPDNTPEVAARLCVADPRVNYVRNEQNLGLIGTVNRGILEWAAADYILVISADDYLLPDALARAVWVMDKHRDVDLVFGQARVVRDDALPVTTTGGPVPEAQVITGAAYLKRSCEVGTPAPSPSVLVRTSAQKRLGGYCANFPHTSDMELWMRFAANGPIGVVREAQAGYRWHGGNMTLAYTNRAVSDRRERIATCEYVYQTHGGANIEGFAGWIAAMKQSLGREAIYNAGRAAESGNRDAYDACVAFALECDPSLARSLKMLRLKFRRLVGPAIAKLLRIGVERLRGRAPSPDTWLDHDSELGWWPQPPETAPDAAGANARPSAGLSQLAPL
ncbi:MAG: glycosyltransferase [Alphaproteobacteria bacterium]